jgi:hypothetical protein
MRIPRRLFTSILAPIALTAVLVSVPTVGRAETAYPSNAAAVAVSAAPQSNGYRIVAADGGVFAFGDARFHGSMGGQRLNSPVVGMAGTASGGGYWLVAADGGVFAFGDAGFYGSMGGQRLNSSVVGMAATPSSAGYWLVAADGGIFAFGDARFHGSMGGQRLNSSVVGMAATPSGGGYWLVASDGGIFAFGDARFYGSMGGQRLNSSVVGMAATPSGGGYWLVAADGGVFAFGDARFHGSMGGQQLNSSVVGMAATPSGGGYWLVAADGGIFAFGDARFQGRIVYGTAAQLAQQILQSPRIDKSGRLVREDLENAAAGRPATAGAPLSATMLRLIVTLSQSHTMTITALESGGTGHSTNSLHYSGAAFDLGRLDGQYLTGRNTPSLVAIHTLAPYMPVGSAFGQRNCPLPPQTTLQLPSGIGTVSDTCDHLHVQLPRGTP